MKRVYITRYGGPEVLKVREEPGKDPAPGEMRVAVKAAGVNFADVMARKGLYPDAPPPPCVVGYEVSGVVEALGEGVETSWLGREVLAGTKFGGYSEKVVVPEDQVYPKPKTLSFEQAAGLVVNYLAAWELTVVMGALKKGEWVLIHNAGGGVGLAALDIAKHLGARTIGTASGGKHAFLKSRGLEHAVDYRKEDFVRAVRRITGGKGVDLALDPLGGANWKRSLKTLARTGRLGMFGISVASESRFRWLGLLRLVLGSPWFHPVSLMNRNRGVFGVNVGRLWHEQERLRSWMGEILKGVEGGWVDPHVDRSFKFDEAAGAHRHLEERRNIGKVVLVP